MNLKTIIASCFAAGSVLTGAAQASFVANYHPNFDLQRNASLFVFGAEGTSGTITNNDGFSEVFTIGADGVLLFDLPDSAFMDGDGTVNKVSHFLSIQTIQ